MQLSRIQKTLSNLTTSQKIGILLVVLLFALIPLLMIGVLQQQLLLGRATHDTPTPVNESPVVYFETSVEGEQLRVDTYVNTYGTYVDGFQVVAEIQDDNGLITRMPEAFSVSAPDSLTVVANDINYQADSQSTQVVYGLFTTSPDQPFRTLTTEPLIVGTFYADLDTDHRGTIVIAFDEDKTKVINRSSGENMALNLPATTFSIGSSPAPSGSPWPTPSSTPSPSPTPTPPPLPDPVRSSLTLQLRVQDYDASTALQNFPPAIHLSMWNVDTNEQIYSISEPDVSAAGSTILVDDSYAVTETISALLYIHAYGRLTQVTPVTLVPDAYLEIDLRSSPLLAGEVSGDNVIDIEDYYLLARSFDPDEPTNIGNYIDFNFDGYIDILDYALLAENYDPLYEGPNPPYSSW